MDIKNCGGNEMVIDYECEAHCGGTAAAQDTHVTQCDSPIGGRIEFLDRMAVQCDTDKILVSWRAETCGDEKKRIRYACAQAACMTYRMDNHYTPCNKGSGVGINYLDRHNPRCPDLQVMTRWHFKRSDCGSLEDKKVHWLIQY